MLPRVRQWWRLPAGERRRLLLLLLMMPALSLALRVFGYRRTRRRVDAWTLHASPRRASEGDLQAAERLAQLARMTARGNRVATNCLRQALAVYSLLRRDGLEPELKFGVDRVDGGAPDMHAWVELHGTPLAQPGLRHRAFHSATSASTASSTAGNTS